MTEIMQSIVKDLLITTKPNDTIKIFIDHEVLKDELQLKFMKAGKISADYIIDAITKLAQSGKILSLDERMKFQVLIIRNQTGSGGEIKRLGQYLSKKQCVVKIKSNKDDCLCALRAIIVGKTIADSDKNYDMIKDSRNNIQTSLAIKLAHDVGLPINEPLGIKDLMKVESFLKEYQIIVINGDIMSEIDYARDFQEKKIVLFYQNNHFDVIKSIPAFFRSSYFCYKCFKTYSTFETHPCNHVCKKCKDRNCKFLSVEKNIKCEFCDVICTTFDCYIKHRDKVCCKIPKCVSCGSFIIKNHVCTGKWCFFCRTEVEIQHKCFILTEQENYERNKNSLKSCAGFIFFDYEAMQSETSHEVNLVCATKKCIECINNLNCTQEDCGNHYWYTNGTFCTWLFNKKNKNFIAIAHNMKAYDGYFIMNYIVNNIKPNERLPEIVLNGSKILVINFANVTIKDSLNFIPMALSKFPKTFGLAELKKGYFPHFFNIKENQNYKGKFPQPDAYGFKFMSVEESKKFLIWHKEQEHKIFDFQEELLLYCQSDVDILTQACLRFRSLFLEITKQSKEDSGVDPFTQCLTMPAACHYVFRRNFMKSKTIALIPPDGYNSESTSYKAILWLQYISGKNNINIQHARNSREKRINDFKVDCWDAINKTVYEFHGCGCPKCYSGDSYNSLKNELMSITYTKHLDRIEKIKNNSEVHSFFEILEFEYDKLLKENEEFYDYVKNQGELRPRLEPRNALAGGRTNAIILHHAGRMGYVDFTSLYPYIQKYGEFPIGHPEIITENFQSLDKYFGLILV